MSIPPTTEQLSSLLDVRYPIIQAPMAGVSTPELAAAVSNAGGLGSIGIGASTPEQAKTMIEQTQDQTAQPFNVNVFCHQKAQRDSAKETQWLQYLSPLFAQFGASVPDQLEEIYPSFCADETMLKLLLELKPAVISFHFGLPATDTITTLRAAGITTLATATSLPEAQAIEAAGVDAIVAQGMEAGGHRGIFDPSATDQQLSTSVLVRLLAQNTSLPVIAAGGIMDGHGIRAALDLGAVAAQLGTAFVPCPESAAHPRYRARLLSARGVVTRLTAVLSGRPARGIVNDFINFCSHETLVPDYPIAYDATKKLNAIASGAGNDEYAPYWAGQGASLAREMGAADLMSVLVQELTIDR